MSNLTVQKVIPIKGETTVLTVLKLYVHLARSNCVKLGCEIRVTHSYVAGWNKCYVANKMA